MLRKSWSSSAIFQAALAASIGLRLLIVAIAPFIAVAQNSAVQKPQVQRQQSQEQAPTPAGFLLSSTDFMNGQAIPPRFTCDGANISPLLSWTAPPAGTQTYVLIMDDPDAPKHTWVHWLVYDIPADASGLPDNLPSKPELETGARQGANDFHEQGYGGPCPPKGSTHRYYFRLYAVDTRLGLLPGAMRADIERAMQGHVLAEVELMGQYARVVKSGGQ
jgi:Raf kinase inhibitor-like YbhB/YbcL family protein